MESFHELISARFSVRNYKNQAVEREKILEVLDAARLAPSAVNFQPWQFIVALENETLRHIYAAYPRKWIESAPVVILALLDRQKSWKRSDGKDFGDIDVAIAIDHMTLQATELGLGTCWVCNFSKEIISASFNLPDHLEPVALIPLGYPDVEPPVKKRK